MAARFLDFFMRRHEHNECAEIRDLLSEFLDNDLTESDLDEVEKHLSECEPCAAFMDTLKATIELLRASVRNDAPPGFRDRVREQLQKS